MDDKRPSALIIMRPMQECGISNVSGSPSSPRAVGRRRKHKMSISTKSNEEMILQCQQQLLEYVENIDEEVKKIVKNHEAEFLLAYRNHLKLVKNQMEQLKQRSLESMNQHKHYLQHIQGLEKQIIIFREESLKLSQKNIKQAEKIEKLNYQVKLLKLEKQKEEAKVAQLTLKNKQLKAILCQQQPKNHNSSGYRQTQKTNVVSLNKTLELTSNISKGENFNMNERPFTTQFKLKGHQQFQIRNKAIKKNIFSTNGQRNQGLAQDSAHKPSKIQQQQTIQRKLKSEHQNQAKDRFSLRQNLLKKIRNPASYTQKELEMLKSKHLVDKNEYESIFKACVEEVRKEVLRRNGILGLNYFKLHGPRDLAQFKKVDYYMLLQLFFKNQLIIQTFYELMFAKKDLFQEL